MIRHIFTIALCGLIALCAADAGPMDAANRQFDAGDFSAAAAAYEEILTERGPDAAVLYNLGNSYQSEKRYGPAILAYERARLITPRDPDLLTNLALARKAATAFEENGSAHPRRDAVLGYLSRNELSWLVVGSAGLLGILALVAGAISLPRPARKPAFVSAVAAAMVLAAAAAALVLRRDEADRGIVLTDSAPVHISPFETAETLGTADAGRTIRLGTTTGGFTYIDVPQTHLRGWIAANDVAAIAR